MEKQRIIDYTIRFRQTGLLKIEEVGEIIQAALGDDKRLEVIESYAGEIVEEDSIHQFLDKIDKENDNG